MIEPAYVENEQGVWWIHQQRTVGLLDNYVEVTGPYDTEAHARKAYSMFVAAQERLSKWSMMSSTTNQPLGSIKA